MKSFPNDHYQCYNAAGFKKSDIVPSFTKKLPKKMQNLNRQSKQHQQQTTESISEDTIHGFKNNSNEISNSHAKNIKKRTNFDIINIESSAGPSPSNYNDTIQQYQPPKK